MVELLGRFPSADLLCLGDLFDLSANTQHASALQAVGAYFDHYSRLTRALRKRLASGARVTLVVGNHDAELGASDVGRFLADYLDARRPDAFSIAPWFVRRGSIHLEHGHVWDEDNAPIHPLALPRRDEEPLGVALTRHVLAPTRAYQFAHAHQTTPLAGLRKAFGDLGVRAPEIVLRYFATGSRILWSAVNRRHESSARTGTRRGRGFAQSCGLAPGTVERLEALRPTPRQADPAATFARLYFDRASAAVLTTGAVLSGAFSQQVGYLVPAAAGLIYLAASRGDRAQRYSGWVVKRLESAALGIRPVVGARAVIFGHTHVAQARAGYANTGSFGFPTSRGRPFLLLESGERLSRGWLEQADRDFELESLDPIVFGRADDTRGTRQLEAPDANSTNSLSVNDSIEAALPELIGNDGNHEQRQNHHAAQNHPA